MSPEIPSTAPVTGVETTPSTSESANPKEKISKEKAAAYINDPRFNQTFQLPANPSRGRPNPFQVSYADYGFRREEASDNGAEEQVFLFFGPLMSSRFHHIAKDELAKRYKIRIVSAERPGIGKTDNVPAEERLEVWRESMAALLNHLDIKHVFIACHSAGTVFGLDFALHYPQFLHPSRPYIAFGAPWVYPSHSGVLLWSLISSLPSSLVGQTDKLASFANSLGPSLGVSAAVSGSVVQLWNQAKPSGREGPDVDLEESLRGRLSEYIFADSVRGLSQESQVILRNGAEKNGWSGWSDFDVLAPRLVEAVRSIGGAKLEMDVFFAEKDVMIGDADTKGPKWFESCWKNVDGVEFTSETAKGSDHDRVWDLRWDVMEKVFKRITQGV